MQRMNAFVLAAAAVAACGEAGAPDAAAPRRYLGTQSPGDVWTWSIGATTFEATNLTTGYRYSGGKSDLPSGFLRLLITASTDPAATLPSVAYALEYPNTVLLVKLAEAGEGLVAAVGLGSCPATAQDYDWVTVPSNTWHVDVNDAYGTARLTPSGGTYTITGVAYRLDGTAPAPGFSETATCAGGELRFAGGATGAVTPSRALMVDNGPGTGGGIGLVAPPAPVDLGAVAAREYRGVLLKRRGGVDETEPIGAEPAGGGNLRGFCFTNVETGERCVSTEDATIALASAAQPTPGIVRLRVTDDGGPHDFVFALSQLGGRYMLFGISTNAAPTEPYNVMLIER